MSLMQPDGLLIFGACVFMVSPHYAYESIRVCAIHARALMPGACACVTERQLLGTCAFKKVKACA
jgi:2-keto-3-deoxy-6-phosphogluconate aldolase